MFSKLIKYIASKRLLVSKVQQAGGRPGRERRLTAIFPANSAAASGIVQCHELHHRLFFLSLVSSRCTCLVEFRSQRRALRASLLLLDGKILGAVYARRSVPEKIYGRNAYLQILTEMAHPETETTVRGIGYDIALALAPLLGSRHSKHQTALANADAFQQIVDRIALEKASGIAFAYDEGGDARSAMYFFDGYLFCSYSFDADTHSFDEWQAVTSDSLANVSYVRLLITDAINLSDGGKKLLELIDIEGEVFTTSLPRQDLDLPARLLKQHSQLTFD